MKPRAAVIVGIGQTTFTRWNDPTVTNELRLACEAVLAAAADAGVSVRSIDGVTSFGGDLNEPPLLQSALGLPELRVSSMLWGGGGAGSCGAVHLAAMAVETGAADCVAVVRSIAQGQTGRYGLYDPNWRHASFTHPFGLLAAPQLLALTMRRHMHEYGTTVEQMGAFAIACREHAHRNPKALMRNKPMDLGLYLASRMIADPFRLFDCCLESNGACAVLVVPWERAGDLRQKPVRLLASVHGSTEGWSTGPMGSFNQPLNQFCTTGARHLASDLYARAGIGAADIDVAQFYDNFSGIAMIAMEDYGLCSRGESGSFVASGATRWPTGALPINTHGGNLSEAYIHGLNHVVEGVRQIRGSSTCQVAGAEICLVTGGPGPAPTSALVLGRA
jgi:acetyl-CoA acetyltransferase